MGQQPRSKIFEDYHAVARAIESCERLEQLENAEKMIGGFLDTHSRVVSASLFVNDLNYIVAQKLKTLIHDNEASNGTCPELG